LLKRLGRLCSHLVRQARGAQKSAGSQASLCIRSCFPHCMCVARGSRPAAPLPRADGGEGLLVCSRTFGHDALLHPHGCSPRRDLGAGRAAQTTWQTLRQFDAPAGRSQKSAGSQASLCTPPRRCLPHCMCVARGSRPASPLPRAEGARDCFDCARSATMRSCTRADAFQDEISGRDELLNQTTWKTLRQFGAPAGRFQKSAGSQAPVCTRNLLSTLHVALAGAGPLLHRHVRRGRGIACLLSQVRPRCALAPAWMRAKTRSRGGGSCSNDLADSAPI
jgi:hypothetical protein